MNTNKLRRVAHRLAIILLIFAAVNILRWAFPSTETWNSKVYDLLFSLRSNYQQFQPVYNDTIVLVDLNDTSLQHLQTYYLDRSHYSRLIKNLSNMGVAAQLYDFIFAAPSKQIEDLALIEATEQSGNTYFGLAFKFDRQDRQVRPIVESTSLDYLSSDQWKVKPVGNAPYFHQAVEAVITFPPLAEASRGLGFLNMIPDADGVFRRIPLLVHYQDALYPSLPFRAMCDILEVSPENIRVDPGHEIILLDANVPGSVQKRSIHIPIDKQGNIIINFIGPWGQMKHYDFYAIYRASEDQDEMDIWREELKDKIVVVSDVSTGSSDVGIVPTDSIYPLSGLNASVLNTILTESFIHDTPRSVLISIELFLLSIIIICSFQQSSLTFFSATVALAGGYFLLCVCLFFLKSMMFPIVTPLVAIFVSLVALQILRALENAQILQKAEMEKGLLKHELEIGRKIQTDFFPEQLPNVSGWELSAYFRPAREVAGDFYDVFWLVKKRLLALVIADVCDKGVGAALFMALIRTLIRVTSCQLIQNKTVNESQLETQIEQALLRTIQVTSDYIAQTHSKTNMFATIFIGILDVKNGCLYYVNCGHEPPLLLKQNNRLDHLKPTGPAVGLLPDLTFKPSKVLLDSGDLLFAFTDGVTDAGVNTGETITVDHLKAILAAHDRSATGLIEMMIQEIENHMEAENQFDDITMIAVSKT